MILVLTGPTGTGKSKLAISLANRINGEIVNADAFQVYEKLRIATA
ncbi:MAG TPA: tRNA (adenosine(37)-N6)-dimethylallyltransferase MiaA, partial [Firmicutes bacterium]|nr:tRNA (adenosine(37)-N6)-dimethylallyltransferase MiaA [Bacillota bacterium]